MSLLLLGAGKAGSGSSAPPLDTLSPTGAWSFSRNLLTSFGAGTKYDVTSGAVTTVYDQSGNSRNLTDGGVSGHRPTVVTVGPNSRTGAQFSASGMGLSGAAISSFITATDGYFIVSGLFDGLTLNNATPYQNQPVIADGAQFFGVYGKTSTILSFNWDGNADAATWGSTPSTATPYVMEWRHEGGNVYIRVNAGSWVSAASGNTGALTGFLRMGTDNLSQVMNGRIVDFAIFNAVPIDSVKDALAADFKTWIGA